MSRSQSLHASLIGDQPTEQDLLDCKYEGYAGVVNLRNDGEPEQPMSTTAEGDRVRAVGMEYLHHGVGGRPLADPGVSEVCDFIDRLSAEGSKVLVHCRKGGTSPGAGLDPAGAGRKAGPPQRPSRKAAPWD